MFWYWNIFMTLFLFDFWDDTFSERIWQIAGYAHNMTWLWDCDFDILTRCFVCFFKQTNLQMHCLLEIMKQVASIDSSRIKYRTLLQFCWLPFIWRINVAGFDMMSFPVNNMPTPSGSLSIEWALFSKDGVAVWGACFKEMLELF